MRIRATMVKTNWDMTVEHVNNRVPLIDVKEIKDFDEEIVLGLINEDDIWITRTHFRDKDTRGNWFGHIAFEIVDYKGYQCENTNINSRLELYLVTKDDELNDDNKLMYNVDTDLWFQPTSVKSADTRARVRGYKSMFHTESTTVTASGSAYVVILDKENHKILYRSPKVLFLPSSMSFAEYKQMIFDLIYLRDELVRDKRSKVGMAVIEEYPISIIKDSIDKLERFLLMIDKSPNLILVRNYEYKKIKNNEKLAPKDLLKKAIHPYKKKHKVMVQKETSNVYENQVIKLSLLRLRRKLKFYMEHIDFISKPNLNLLQKNIEEEKERLVKYANASSKIVGSLENEYSKIKEKEAQFISKINQIQDEDAIFSGTSKIRLYLTAGEDIVNLYLDNSNMETGFSSTYNNRTFRWDLSFRYEICDENTGKWIKAETDGQKYLRNISRLINKDIKKHLFLLYNISNLLISETTIINGLVKMPNCIICKDDPLKIGSYNGFPDHEITLTDIFMIDDINFEGFCNTLDINEGVNLFYKYDKEMMDIHDVILPYNRIKNQQDNIKNQQDNLSNQSERIILFYSKINDLLKLEFMKDIKEENIIIKPTQVFIKDKIYRQVWGIINSMNKEVQFLDENLEGKIINLKKTCDIYEIWCYFKILHLLVYQIGWKIVDGSLKEKLDNLFVNYHIDGLPNGFYIDLSHLTYEGDEIKLRFHNNQEVQGLRPDYRFEFSINSQVENVYLDAKYRDYNTQGISKYIEDIEEVAYGKYIKRFEYTNYKASASFIMHCEEDPKYTNFGGFYDRKEYTFKNGSLLNSPSHRYGAFIFRPSNQQNFILWFKMIMEYILPYYNTCWQCGEYEDIKIHKRLTKGGYAKYNIYCNNCDSFWVKTHCDSEGHKLVKHVTSYHHRDSNQRNVWWVTCPKCINLSAEYQEDFYELFDPLLYELY